MKKLVAYYRVSTKKQGESGLGLEAQQAAVKAFAKANGSIIVKEFTEVESGRKTDKERPNLALALPFAKRAGAVLVVAKLDRLARNAHFLTGLMESNVGFVCCDNPFINKLTVTILAAVAQDEREQISSRTKAALAMAKKRGVLLGSARPGHWQGREEARRAGAIKGAKRAGEVVTELARAGYADLRPQVIELRKSGMSYRRIANQLNQEGARTRRNASFTAWHTRRIALNFKGSHNG